MCSDLENGGFLSATLMLGLLPPLCVSQWEGLKGLGTVSGLALGSAEPTQAPWMFVWT